MNIVKTLRALFNYYDLTSKCSECWEFEAPLTERIANTSLPKSEDSECCYRVFLVNLNIRENKTYNDLGLISDRYDEYTFDLLVLKESEIGRNVDLEQVHQEDPSEPIQYTSDESKWEEYLQPLRDCLDESILSDLCLILGRSLRNPLKNWTPLINYADQNYDGWRIRMGIQDYDPDNSDLFEYFEIQMIWHDDGSLITDGEFNITLTGEESSKTYDEFTISSGGKKVMLNEGMDTNFGVSLSAILVDPPLTSADSFQLQQIDGKEVLQIRIVRNSVVINGILDGDSLGSDELLTMTGTGQSSMNSYLWQVAQKITPISDAFIGTPYNGSEFINFLQISDGYAFVESGVLSGVNNNLIIDIEVAPALAVGTIDCVQTLIGDDNFTCTINLSPGTEVRLRSILCTDSNDPFNTETTLLNESTFVTGEEQPDIFAFDAGLPLPPPGEVQVVILYERFDPSNFYAVEYGTIPAC